MHATDAGLIQQPQKLPEAGDMWVTLLVIYNPLELFGFFPCMYVSSSFFRNYADDTHRYTSSTSV
jgi:hypothetical protein